VEQNLASPTRRRRRSPITVVIVSALVAAGCGGDGKAAVSTSVPADTSTTELVTTTTEAVTTTTTAAVTTTAPPATTAPPVPTADMTAQARAAVLQATDFPAGFAPVPDADEGGLKIETMWGELIGCLGLSPAKTNGIGTSPTFLQGLATQARTTVDYTTEPAAAAIAAAIAGPKFTTCFNDVFTANVKRTAPEGGVPGPVTINKVKGPAVAPKMSAYRINVTISLDELQVPLFQDYFIIFAKGAVIRAWFLKAGSEFPQDLERSLLEKVVARA